MNRRANHENVIRGRTGRAANETTPWRRTLQDDALVNLKVSATITPGHVGDFSTSSASASVSCRAAPDGLGANLRTLGTNTPNATRMAPMAPTTYIVGTMARPLTGKRLKQPGSPTTRTKRITVPMPPTVTGRSNPSPRTKQTSRRSSHSRVNSPLTDLTDAGQSMLVVVPHTFRLAGRPYVLRGQHQPR